MKFTTSFISSLLLAPVAFAHPRAIIKDEPLPETSRITAFVVNDKGEPSVECWAIGLANSMETQRADGSKSMSRAVSLLRDHELAGLDILTWPSYSSIWPPAEEDEVRSETFDLAESFNLFNVQGGLIDFQVFDSIARAAGNDDEVETHIFNMENGDDWFYFEDASYPSSSRARTSSTSPPPFTISTISGSETELLRLKYKSQPKHSVLHKGACSFTGIDTSAGDKSSESARGHSGFTVQVNVEDL